MWEFSEAFMEECIAENIYAFISEALTHVDRQPRINGFRPDLIFEDEQKNPVIVEIQQRALDRSHLYKLLEYRDHWRSRSSRNARIVLICESIDQKYIPITKTHDVEVFAIPREKFIALAARNCPNALTSALSSPTKETWGDDDLKAKRGKLIFRDVDWRDYANASEFLIHLHQEFTRLGISREEIPRDRYGHMLYQIEHFLNDGLYRAISAVGDPHSWNLAQLMGPNGDCLRKPRLSLVPHITMKGNLSVIWYPREAWNSGKPISDWQRFSESSYGWTRPENELLFIHDVEDLRPGSENLYGWDDRANWHVLDSIFIALIRASFNHLVEALKSVCDVELVNDFEFDCDQERLGEGHVNVRQHIKGWRIYNLDERKRENDNKWLDGFAKQYGLTPEEFIGAYEKALQVPRRATHNVVRHLTADLKKRGLKFVPSEVQAIHDRLRAFHWLWPEALRKRTIDQPSISPTSPPASSP